MSIRLAILGFGGMGSWHAQNVMEKLPGTITVAAAYDIRPEAIKKAKDMGLKTYGNLNELLNDKEIDLVTIAVPNNIHKELSIACLSAGKNVICEKPVTLNAKELEEIITVQKRTGKLFTIHQNRRWDKDFRIVKAAYEQGLLGELYFVESKVQGSRQAMHGWRGYRKNGGGMLLDWGVHLLDQMLQLIKSPVISVDAQLLSVFTPEVDDNIKLTLRFENGCCACLEMATNCLINSPRWHIQGTEGTLQIDDWNCNGILRKLKQEGKMEWADDIVYTEAGPTRTMAPRPAYTVDELVLPQVNSDWSDYYRNVVDVLSGKAELLVKPEEALRVMRLIDLLFESSEKKCGISCRL